MGKIKGYNIILELDDKKVAGVTSNSFGVKPKFKESYIKDDAGVAQTEHVGNDVDFSIAGLVILEDGVPTKMDVDALIDAALAGTLIPFVYSRIGSTVTRTGNLKIVDYKEDSDSENVATYSASCKVEGDLGKGVLA